MTNQLLIAMPNLLDPNFHKTVTLICEHNEQGALGIVINRPLDLQMGEVFEQMALSSGNDGLNQTPVLDGGPVAKDRGFVLHTDSDKTKWESTIRLPNNVGVTTSRDILSALAEGDGPDQAVVALGYAGWDAGQLDAEMAANAWLTVSATDEILFDTPFEDRWQSAADLLGVNLSQLGPTAGHA
ncbi:MAG: YqgE/AlgH family protein [Pseudomonadota bacterium]